MTSRYSRRLLVTFSSLLLSTAGLLGTHQSSQHFEPFIFCLFFLVFSYCTLCLGFFTCRLNEFAGVAATKLGVSKEEILPYLWGDFYYSPKSKTFCPKAQVIMLLIINRSYGILRNLKAIQLLQVCNIIGNTLL